jgi:hypothetical protein
VTCRAGLGQGEAEAKLDLFRTDDLSRRSANRARCVGAQRASHCDQDMVGITNSAPARMPVGQRLVIVFNLV